MALLPDGMSEDDSRAILSDVEPSDEEIEAASILETARLASRASGRWRLLAPIRETLLADFPPEPEDRARLVSVFLQRAELGNSAGTVKWNEVREELTTEAGNLDAIIAAAAREPKLPKGLGPAANGLFELHRHTGLASCASLAATAKRFHESGELLGEASCMFCVGYIALARSDHDGAREQFAAAAALYRKASAALGEANCIKCLGDIAHRRSDHGRARQHYEAALPLYQKVGDALGEANCIRSLGDIAFSHSDHDAARQRYEAALSIYQRVGNVRGEANCIRSLGDVALARSDHEGARRRYEAALSLYEKVGDLLGEAVSIVRLGEIALGNSDYDGARQRYEAALPLFQSSATFSARPIAFTA
jgi:tetratricopeptide (TPR) repeat protein